jgi:hypothetical protein
MPRTDPSQPMTQPGRGDDPRNVRCTSDAGGFDVYFTLDGDAAPELPKGFGGWAEESRARRRALYIWGGAPAWTQTVPVILDAYLAAALARAQAAARRQAGRDVGRVTSDAEATVARQYAAIRTLWTPRSPTAPPPTCSLYGAALEREGGNWVLLDRQRSETPMRNPDDGALLRWRGVLTFGQIVERDVLEISGLSTPTTGKPQTYKWKTGDTLQRVAAKLLGKASRWQELTFADGSKIRGNADPKLKAGVVLKAPAK